MCFLSPGSHDSMIGAWANQYTNKDLEISYYENCLCSWEEVKKKWDSVPFGHGYGCLMFMEKSILWKEHLIYGTSAKTHTCHKMEFNSGFHCKGWNIKGFPIIHKVLWFRVLIPIHHKMSFHSQLRSSPKYFSDNAADLLWLCLLDLSFSGISTSHAQILWKPKAFFSFSQWSCNSSIRQGNW